MCGIAGFLGPGDTGDIAAMGAALAHRGPDGAGVWASADDPVFLAIRRLAIVDIAGGGQPMVSPGGELVVVFNGEIYNQAELRRELESAGHRFQSSHSDTEVLLHGYREWGTDLPNRLNGMWAFGLYDGGRRQLFLSRDRLGQKPLYYTQLNGGLAFASELTGLLRHSSIRPSISMPSVRKYFAYGFIPAPHSLYESIYKLPAGCNLVCDVADPQPAVTRYWDFALEPCDAMANRPEEDLAEELRELLRTTVRRRLMSDVPVGLFMSGGLDSSAVARFAMEAAGGRRLQSFSVGFEEPDFDESRNAAEVAALIGTEHIESRFSSRETEAHCLRVAARLDEPLGDCSIVPTYLLCATARPHVTVALGGDGADELFGGYDTFRALPTAERYSQLIPPRLHAAVRAAARLFPVHPGYMSFDFRLDRLLRGLAHPPRLWNPVWLGALDPGELQECFREPADVEDVYSEAIALWDNSPSPDSIDRTTLFYVKLYLQDGILTKLDRAGMMNSLEVRSPFLDIDVVNFARRLPARLKLRNGRTKYLLKLAMKDLLPTEVIHRKKHGFPFPAAQWFRDGSFNGAFSAIAGQQPEFVAKKLRDHRRGTRNERLFLWNQWLLHQVLTREG